ncbi:MULTISPECIES: hypothetical protein [Bradyrhizobium]|uniref:Uncharacterized protein n=1 Tax=Bradyrhizobium brasilense TaxID=1419277 RepID=A0ABY8JL06_9BRAD|nr:MULTISPECIES: hypothetical protein [Bradyrhizobium]WFU66126.1 hypothetical protein QA636_11640 [Bradyrhizobium brasilense]
MEEFFRFIQASGRERRRLIQEACAISDSVIPPARVSKQDKKPPMGQAISNINAGVVS